MKLRTVIVDDEPLARDMLSLLLADHQDIDIVSQCKNGREAIAYLQAMPVDLLFLDVQMTKVSGFDVVKQVGLRHLPPTVFVTAYHEHAVRAFDVHAVDYLTKPVEAERLTLTLERVREKIAANNALITHSQLTSVLNGLLNSSEGAKEYTERLLVKDGSMEIFLPVETIEWIEAAEYYCCLHANGRSLMLRETITDLSEKLDPKQFVRIHRSSIVNLNKVRGIYREGTADGVVMMEGGQRLRMSRTGRQKLTEIGKG
jgi:two-component system, LytTR family, response regulator